jgi:hypothetical protein
MLSRFPQLLSRSPWGSEWMGDIRGLSGGGLNAGLRSHIPKLRYVPDNISRWLSQHRRARLLLATSGRPGKNSRRKSQFALQLLSPLNTSKISWVSEGTDRGGASHQSASAKLLVLAVASRCREADATATPGSLPRHCRWAGLLPLGCCRWVTPAIAKSQLRNQV